MFPGKTVKPAASSKGGCATVADVSAQHKGFHILADNGNLMFHNGCLVPGIDFITNFSGVFCLVFVFAVAAASRCLW